MPRALLVCSTIVAAFQIHLAAAPALVEDLPIPPSVLAVAERAGVDPQRDPARFMVDLAQALYVSVESRPPVLTGPPVVAPKAPGDTPLTVPIPLSAALWSSAVFRHIVPPDQLIAAIVTDRRAMLLCRGLSGLDDDTLEYFAQHPAVLRLLYDNGVGAFAAFGSALHIRADRVVPPGGSEFEPLWRAAGDAPLDRPDRFVRRAFVEDEGRFAYVLDAIDAAPPAAARFALGAALPADVRVERFREFVAAVIRGFQEWHPEHNPFSRPIGDVAMLLLRVQLDPSGALAAPTDPALWSQILEAAAKDRPIDVAWLVNAIGGLDMYSRLERLDRIGFTQRVFADASPSDLPVVARVVRGYGRYRMLLLSLERAGMRTPALYDSAMQCAERLGQLDDASRFWTVAEFQGALAFVQRLQRVGAIDRERTRMLIAALVELPPQDDGYGELVIDWWRTQITPLLPPTGSWEQRTIEAAAGRAPAERARLLWEGQWYAIDLAFAERQRMATVRAKQPGFTLDIALALDDLGRRLRSVSRSLGEVRAVEEGLRAMARESGAQLQHPSVHLMPPGVTPSRDALEWVTDLVRSLERVKAADDLSRVARVATSLQALAERAFAEALLSLAYAAELGDPEGPAMLAGNVAMRHDFGFGRRDTDGRLKTLWALPRQEFQPGVPWHLGGSLLGLDIALAPLALRRMNMDRLADAPRLSSIERESLAVSVALLEPSRLTDHDRDTVAAAVERGRARVDRLTAHPGELDSLTTELGLGGYRRRSLAFALKTSPAAVVAQFSVSDLLLLGGASLDDLHAWGQPALYSTGCVCTSFQPSRAWRALEGRVQLPVMTATMGDLNLTMGIMLRDLGVPTALLKAVLTLAMQELIDGLGDRGDWWGLSAAARDITRQTVEDYVSFAAAVDGPLVPIDELSSRN